jgi:enoyl-CoA hydratase
MKVADKIANLSQHAVMMIKEAINRGFATTLAEGTRFERGQFYSLFATEDQKEGMAAFIEKRPPVFKNVRSEPTLEVQAPSQARSSPFSG